MKKQVLISMLLLGGGWCRADVLYSNGPVVDSVGLSVMTPPTLSGGFGAQSSVPNTVADDFTVTGSGWTVTDLGFYSYQTNSSSFTFTSATWSIVAGDVNTGELVASGTTTVTNGGLQGFRVMASDLGDTSRPIYSVQADITDTQLAVGSYWLRWSLAGSSALTGPWALPTVDGRPGNAQQSLADAPFVGVIDGGSDQPVELSFVLGGYPSAVPEPQAGLAMGAGLALLAVLRRRASATRPSARA